MSSNEDIKKLNDKIDEFYMVFHKLDVARSKDLDRLFDEIGQLKERVSRLEESRRITNNYYFGSKDV